MADNLSGRPVHLVPAHPLRCPRCTRRLSQPYGAVLQAAFLTCEVCPGALFVVMFPRRGMALMLEVRSKQARALRARRDLSIVDTLKRLRKFDATTLEAYRLEISERG